MGMLKYTVRRVLQAIPVLLGITVITFFLINAIPGDPVRIMIGPGASAEMVERTRAKYGLHRPIYLRYLSYLGGILQGDLGTSIHYGGESVLTKIIERLPVTLLLMGSAFAFAISTAIPLGIIAAKRRNKPTDHVSRIIALIGVSTPSFWIGLMLIIIFSFHLDVLPGSKLILPWAGVETVEGAETRIDVLIKAGRHLIMPTITLGTLYMAAIMRIERSSMLEVLDKDYVQLARAYGVPESVVTRKYAFRPGQLPVVTIIGMQLTSAIGGAVLTEIVFNINGMGRLIITAIQNQDFELVMGTTLMFGVAFVIGVIITDLTYAYIDPRVSYGEESV